MFTPTEILGSIERPVTTYPQYADTESATDQQSALEATENQATNMANAQCIGNVVSIVVLTRNIISTGISDKPELYRNCNCT